jgi:hypothetical protein
MLSRQLAAVIATRCEIQISMLVTPSWILCGQPSLLLVLSSHPAELSRSAMGCRPPTAACARPTT